jgi:hypothetical protein
VKKNEIELLQGKRWYRIRKTYKSIKVSIRDAWNTIISSSVFEAISLIVIIANSIVMALENPADDNSSDFFSFLDYIFLGLYTLEMMLKILGLGFILPKGSYLRDSWNILDFVIVISGYLPLIISSESMNLNVLRSFRVLRPLRTISGIEGLRILVSALLSAIPLLRDTILVLTFFFIIFAIAGLQLWSGVLKKRCINEETGRELLDGDLCGASSWPSGYFWGKTNHNPNYGITNFDNIFFSLLVIFNWVTLEGWSGIMVMVQRSFSSLAFIFFVPLVFVGAFFLLNLTLAVIKSKFTEEHKTWKKRATKMGQSEEEIARKKEIEKRKIQRRLKPFIKRRLLEILAKVRKKIDKEDMIKYNLNRPMSIKGVLRRDLFDDGKNEFPSKEKLNKKNSDLKHEKKRGKRKKTLNEDGQRTIEKMEEESSYEMSSVDNCSNEDRIEEWKEKSSSNSNDGEDSDSEEEKKEYPQKNSIYKPMIKTVSKSPYLTTVKLKGKNKWMQKLNISREIIQEVDEEHKSDTTNRMSMLWFFTSRHL